MEETKGCVYAWIVLENDVWLQENGTATIVTNPTLNQLNQRTSPEKQMQKCSQTQRTSKTIQGIQNTPKMKQFEC